MEVEENTPCRKNSYQKLSFELKMSIIDQVNNGQISVNYAAKKYQVSRSSIQYWIKKFSTLEQKKVGMSKNDEIKRLKEKIAELEFVKDFQQDIIADMELITGIDMSKKSLPQNISKRDSKKEAKSYKRKWLASCFGISKQALYKRLKSHQIKQNQEEQIIALILEHRKKAGQKTGGKKTT